MKTLERFTLNFSKYIEIRMYIHKVFYYEHQIYKLPFIAENLRQQLQPT